MIQVEISSKSCVHCEQQIPRDARFCKFCGSLQPHEGEEIEEIQRNKWLKIIAVFYALDLVICAVVNFTDYFHVLKWLFITEALLASLALIFVSFLWKDIQPMLRWKSFTVAKSMVYVVSAVVFAIVVNVAVKWLNKSIFDQDVYYYGPFRSLLYPKIGMITLVALVPALFEELSYRGIILEGLFKITDQKQAILIAAFLFAVIHMSFISFFWLLPFAVWLGNVRLKEKTIWYGVLIHFSFNMTACLFEFYELNLLGVNI